MALVQPLIIQDMTLRDSLAAELAITDVKQLQPWWAKIISDSNRLATNMIYARLGLRGYSPQQISQWDQAANFAGKIGLYWCLRCGNVGASYPEEKILPFDWSGQLDTVGVTISGVVTVPANTSYMASGGRLNETTSGGITMDTQF